MEEGLAPRVRLHVWHEHRAQGAHFVDQAWKVREVDPCPGRDPFARGIAPRHHERVVVERRPHLGDVAAEGPARLLTDGGCDSLRRRTVLKPWGDGEDPVERLARIPFLGVELGALECLPAEVRRYPRHGAHLLRDRIRLGERKPHRSDEPASHEDRHGQGTRCVRRQSRAVCEAGNEVTPPLHPGRRAFPRRRGDRGTGRQRHP